MRLSHIAIIRLLIRGEVVLVLASLPIESIGEYTQRLIPSTLSTPGYDVKCSWLIPSCGAMGWKFSSKIPPEETTG